MSDDEYDKPNAPVTDARYEFAHFTNACNNAANWKELFLGAAYSTRIKAAIAYLKRSIADAEQHPEIAPAAPASQAQGKNLLRNETSEWLTERGESAMTVHSRMVDGVLCRWWGEDVPPGVVAINAAAAALASAEGNALRYNDLTSYSYPSVSGPPVVMENGMIRLATASELARWKIASAPSSERGQMPEEPTIIRELRECRRLGYTFTISNVGQNDDLISYIDALRAHALSLAELHRMQLTAISVATQGNTVAAPESRIDRDNPYWTISYSDVCTAVDREIWLREENARLVGEVERLQALCAVDGFSREGLLAVGKTLVEQDKELQRLRREPESARNAVIEECANVCDQIQAAGIKDYYRRQEPAGCARAIRALASSRENKDNAASS